jgi:hypothetical protein
MSGEWVVRGLLMWGLLAACDQELEPSNASIPGTPEKEVNVAHAPDKTSSEPILRVSSEGAFQQRKIAAITASGEAEESAQELPSETESRGTVGLEPEIWDPNAFTRPRRRMTVKQLDSAIRLATGGIGWDDSDQNSGSVWVDLEATLGVPDFFRRVHVDLDPGMTFHKFLGDGANVVCTKLINHEQNIAADKRVFLVHLPPGTNPLDDPAATDANIKMLLLRFHGKSVPLDSPQLQPWRNLVNTIAANAGPWWGDWLEAWTGMCVALLKHPNFYSY